MNSKKSLRVNGPLADSMSGVGSLQWEYKSQAHLADLLSQLVAVMLDGRMLVQ